jgi:hypothetical protein
MTRGLRKNQRARLALYAASFLVSALNGFDT